MKNNTKNGKQEERRESKENKRLIHNLNTLFFKNISESIKTENRL
jgi:hypothetical protein